MILIIAKLFIILLSILNALKDTYANECDVVSNNYSTSDPIPSCSVQAAESVFDCVEGISATLTSCGRSGWW